MAEFTEVKTYRLHCPDCGSNRVVKVGEQNGEQRYLCRGCKKKFRANGMPTGRQAPSEQMGMAVRVAVGDIEEEYVDEEKSTPKQSKGGKKGGKARAEALSAERRSSSQSPPGFWIMSSIGARPDSGKPHSSTLCVPLVRGSFP